MPEESVNQVEGPPEYPTTTESEQMYLITVARAVEEGAEGPIPVAALAAPLGVSVASANEMVRKLAGRGLLDYLPYKGVELTEAGRLIAGRVLRTRRLWATFLAEHLDYSAGEADALACHLEHATPPEAAERLADFLGNPKAGPLGRPIPPRSGAEASPTTVPLAEVPVGASVVIASTAVTGPARDFLLAEALEPGTEITVRASGPSGVLVDAQGGWVHLAAEIAAFIETLGAG